VTEKIVLLGAGALARDLIAIYGRERFAVAYVEPAFRNDQHVVSGVGIVSDWTRLLTQASHYLLAVADQDARAALQARARAEGLIPCEPLVYPASFCAASARMGRGSVVTCFVVLGDAAEIAEDTLIMHHTTVGHDSRVGDLSVVCPGVSLGGGSTLGRNCFVGANAVTAPGVSVGDAAVIAAGAACLADVPVGGFAIGSPARRVARAG
jgi:sugar O-acyltransferase (sialic acid O-acetyltransferase NeuD family)